MEDKIEFPDYHLYFTAYFASVLEMIDMLKTIAVTPTLKQHIAFSSQNVTSFQVTGQ